MPRTRSGRRSLAGIALLLALAALWILLGREHDRRGRAVGADEVHAPLSSSELAAPAALAEPAASPEPSVRAPVGSPTPSPASTESPTSKTILVRILEEHTRRPIASASVRLLASLDETPFEAVTAADGTCRIPCPQGEHWPGFHVRAPGFLHLVTRLERRPELEIVLGHGVTLFGRVLAGDTDTVVPGASLSVEHNWCSCPVEPVRSDGAGRYELPLVPINTAFTSILLQAEGFPVSRRWFELRSETERVAQDFVLERGLEIEGRVIDSESAIGVPGARVQDFAADGDGRFRSWIAVAPDEDPFSVQVSAPGYSRVAVPFARSVLAAGAPLELPIPRSAAVGGSSALPTAVRSSARTWRRIAATRSSSRRDPPAAFAPAPWSRWSIS